MGDQQPKNVFQRNLHYFMEGLDMSETKLAKETGISQKTISRYYNGQHKPSPEYLISLASRFGCTAEDLWSYDFQNPEIDRPRQYARLPDVGEKEFRFFEGQSLHAYYLKENSITGVYEGVISFDQAYDRRRKYLHGSADTGHHYDVKLVLEDHDSIFIYGIETDDDRRFHIALHYPTFKSATKYTGGVGILTRLDGDNDFVAQRVVLSEEKIMIEEEGVKKVLLKLLVDDESIPRVWVSAHINNVFRSGIWMEK